MGSLKLLLLAVIFCVSLTSDVSARVQTRGQKVQNILNEKESSKENNDKFETLSKLHGSSDTKKRTLLGENLMKVSEEDDEDISDEGSGDLPKEKDSAELKENDDDDDYLDDEDYEDDDDEDIYDDEEDDYSGDDIYDDEDDEYDDEDYDDYDEEEDYINEGMKDVKEKKEKEIDFVKNYKEKLRKTKDKSSTPKQQPKPSEDEDLHFADDEETGKDLNLPDNEDPKKKTVQKDELLYEYYNEFFEEDEEDYEEEDLNPNGEDKPQQTFTTDSTRVPSEKETVFSRSIPSYFGHLTTSHYLLMAASALISFILFTIAFVVCCYQKRQSAFQKKQFGNVPFVIDSNFLVRSSQKSHHPSNFVNNSSTSIVKNYQRVPTSTKEFLSSDSMSTSCSGLENPNHLPDFMEAGNGETKKPLLP